MRKSSRLFPVVKSMSTAALCALVGACSDMTAPTVRGAASALPPASPALAREAQSHGHQAGGPVAVFVIGDSESNDVGAAVNFWGAQWWKNNHMSDTVSNGVAAFKGYATSADAVCGGVWESRPGNSDDPPAVIGEDIVVVVTSKVIKDGAVIRGDIKRVVEVHQDGGYQGNPGHPGNGVVTTIACNGVATET